MPFPQSLTLIAGPPTVSEIPVEPVSLAEAKAQIEDIDEEYHDSFINSLIAAARVQVENVIGRALISQTFEMGLDDWPCEDMFPVPRPPLQGIVSIKYKDSGGVEATWPRADYIVDPDSEPGRVGLIYSGVWPSTVLQPFGAIKVRFVAGYAAEGTGSISSSGAAVTGLATAFNEEVEVGDTLSAAGEVRTVLLVNSDTSITLSAAFSRDLTAGAYKIGGTKHNVPQPIRQAILLIVGHLYAHREEVLVGQVQTMAARLPIGAAALLAPYRVTWFE